MKKLLVLVLAVVLTLSFVAVVSAATFDPYVGGRVTWAYFSSDATDATKQPVTLNNGGLKMVLLGKIKDDATGTWANVGAKIDGWPNDKTTGSNVPNLKSIYEFGINKIGGSNFDLWYTSIEYSNAKRGQDRIRDMAPAMYHADPFFDHAPADNGNPSGAIAIDYNSDNVIVNIGYEPNKVNVNSDNEAIVAATIKFDGGDVHVGHYIDPTKFTESTVGLVYKAGFGTIKADYLTNSPASGDSSSQAQVGVSIDAIKLEIVGLMDDKYTFNVDGGMGYKVIYSGIADGKVSLAYRALTASDANQATTKNLTDFYIGYKFGVLETRLGAATVGKDNFKQDMVYASVYASLW